MIDNLGDLLCVGFVIACFVMGSKNKSGGSNNNKSSNNTPQA